MLVSCWPDFSELMLVFEPSSSSLRILAGNAGAPSSLRTESASTSFTAHPNRQANDAAACNWWRSACKVAASSATVALALDTTNTAYNSLQQKIQVIAMLAMESYRWKKIRLSVKLDMNSKWKAIIQKNGSTYSSIGSSYDWSLLETKFSSLETEQIVTM